MDFFRADLRGQKAQKTPKLPRGQLATRLLSKFTRPTKSVKKAPVQG